LLRQHRQHIAANGQTLGSEESDGGDEVQSQSQDIIYSPFDPFTLSSMVYDTWQDVKRCYNKYEKKVRFSIKIGSSKKKDKQGEKDKVMFVCKKNGSNVEDNDGSVVKQRKHNKIVKIGCTARLTLKKRDGRWHVTTFHEDHNHPVCDKFEMKSFLRSHRGILEEERRFIELLHNANISSNRMMQIMQEIYRGHKFTPFL
jgi:hypothetical protein